MIEISEKLPELARKNHVELKEQFHSALEHSFLWIFDAQNGHVVQGFMIESGWAKFNKMKIFPIGTFKNVVEELKKLELRFLLHWFQGIRSWGHNLHHWFLH